MKSGHCRPYKNHVLDVKITLFQVFNQSSGSICWSCWCCLLVCLFHFIINKLRSPVSFLFFICPFAFLLYFSLLNYTFWCVSSLIHKILISVLIFLVVFSFGVYNFINCLKILNFTKLLLKLFVLITIKLFLIYWLCTHTHSFFKKSFKNTFCIHRQDLCKIILILCT